MSTLGLAVATCGDCGEPIQWTGSSRGWRHADSGETTCVPRCTTAGCRQLAVVKLGYHGFDGAASRFIRTGWACEQHRPVSGEEYVR